MNSSDFVLFALQITVMLAVAVCCGQLMRRLGQPPVLGEMIGGIVLGPTVFGALAPSLFSGLFQASATVTAARDASIKLGMLFFLFIAGLETNLSDLRQIGRKAILIGGIGTLLPIIAGVALVYGLPSEFWGERAAAQQFAFALFIGMNFANSANPVIARILMDLGLLEHEIGTIIMTATIIDDLINWTLFAIILSDISPTGQAISVPFAVNIALVFAFFIVVLGVGRWLAPRALPWIKQRVSWPSGFIAITALVILLVSSAAEKLGIHAFLGAFLVGAAFGGTGDGNDEANQAISHFVLSFFVPIYFVSMGMNVNFATNFDSILVGLILTGAFLSKIGAVLIGARLAGMPLNRQTLAIGFGLNARGATGIILAGVGLENRLIDERIFVAVVVMALVTSLLSGPAIKWLIFPRQAKALWLPRETVE
ncbi:MAG: cation:proton antiporter [Anaerolineae bacterium]|nr:cation:proton antiporter [Anaerolineae bacterium]